MSDANTPIGRVAKYVKEEIPAQVAKAVSEIEVPKGEDGSDGLGLDLKNWNPGIYREGVLVQHNIGQAYKALVDTNDEPGTSEAWERVGSAGFRWTGVKKADHSYCDGDLYIDGGTTFLFNGGKGYMLAQRGKNGKNGTDGSNGKNGVDAPTIVDLSIVGKELVSVMSDGAIHSAALPQLEELHNVQKQLTWIEEQMLSFENIKAPVRGYEGMWEAGRGYSKGDLVTQGRALYLCFATDTNSTSLDPEKWVQLAGAGGSAAKHTQAQNRHAANGFCHYAAPGGQSFNTGSGFTIIDPNTITGGTQRDTTSSQGTFIYTGSQPQGLKLDVGATGICSDATVLDLAISVNGLPTYFGSSETTAANKVTNTSVVAQLTANQGDTFEVLAQTASGTFLLEYLYFSVEGRL